MLKELQLDDAAPWKERFRAPVVLWATLAKGAPNRGLAASNKSGLCQLYAWDVPSGELRQLTDIAWGQLMGVLSPDGRWATWGIGNWKIWSPPAIGWLKIGLPNRVVYGH